MCKILFSNLSTKFHVEPFTYKKIGRKLLFLLEVMAMASLGHKGYLSIRQLKGITPIQLPKSDHLLKCGFVASAILVVLLLRSCYSSKAGKVIAKEAEPKHPKIKIETPIANSFNALPKVSRAASPPRTPNYLSGKEDKPLSPRKILSPRSPPHITALVARAQQRRQSNADQNPPSLQSSPLNANKDKDGFAIPQPKPRRILGEIDIQSLLKADTASMAKQSPVNSKRSSVCDKSSPRSPTTPVSPFLDKIARLQARRGSHPTG